MVNIEELRKKAADLKQSGGGNNSDFLSKFFMMEVGTSVVRILPAKEESQDFYAETAIHRIDGKNHHCPRVKGNKCPACDTYYDLWNQINRIGKTSEKGRELIKVAKSIKSRKRFYLNAVDRQEGTVKILSVGQKLFGKILDCFLDEDYGDITDLKEGWDFKIIKEIVDDFPNYDKSAPRPKQSPVGTDAESAKYLDELHDIHGLVKVASYDDLKLMMTDLIANTTTTETLSITSPVPDPSPPDEEDYMAHLKDLRVD